MNFYTKLAATAAKLLKQKGQVVTLRRTSGKVYNEGDGSTTETALADTTRMAAFFSFGQGVTTIRGNLVQANDQRAIMEAGVEPSVEDLVVDAAGAVYVVVSINKIQPAGVPVAYDLHLKVA